MDDLQFSEVDSQEYAGNGCIFSAGRVFGHPADSIYVSWVKDGAQEYTLLLRPDEAARLSALLSNALWSYLMEERGYNGNCRQQYVDTIEPGEID